MKVIITGGTGLLGRALSRSLVHDGHSVTALTRSVPSATKQAETNVSLVQWDGVTANGWGALVEDTDVIVNFAGENLGGGRWTADRKRRILESRVNAGSAVMQALEQATVRPRLLVQASAVGYYDTVGSTTITETSAAGTDFQAQVVEKWEGATSGATGLGVQRVVLRTGLPFSLEGGVFPLFLLPFRTFVVAGGKLGSGEQYVPWIHIEDYIRAIRFLMEREDAEGAFNLSAPNPVQQKELASALGEILGRPSFMPAPAFAMKAALGEMSTLVLDGWREVPQRLLQKGFAFKWPDLRPALRDILDKPERR
jgi:uncharacterized protein